MDAYRNELQVVRIGIVLCILGMCYGFILGGVFGAAETSIKQTLGDSGMAALDTHYNGDSDAAQKVINKSWSYFKRAHMHAGAMGAAGLAMLLVIAALPIKNIIRTLIGIGLGIGSVGYPLFWMLAALRAPGMGSTSAAKESLEWLAIPTSGTFILAAVATLILATYSLFVASPSPEAPG